MQLVAAMVLAMLVLTGAAWLRGAEYDEQYTLFLTAGTPRPDWPETSFPAGAVAAVQSGHATLAGIARDLRISDVHPPLYFWAVSLWREAFGPSLFAARLLSVLCGVASLGLIAFIARRHAIPPVTAVLITLGCYGFAYTNSIARGFAPAQLLTLCGVALLLGRRPLLAGVCLGAACCCNYLSVFVVAAVIAVSSEWIAVLAAVPFLVLDAWFFAAQHGSRQGQFPPFRLWSALARLARYQAASVFGGLPLYVGGIWRSVGSAFIGLLGVGLVLYVARAKPPGPGTAIRLILAGAVAPPIGLILLGALFDNTPIELRYFSFGLPFIGLLVAWAAAQRRNACIAVFLLPVILVVQYAGIVGLLLSPATMQPARGTAKETARLIGRRSVVLLPRGNDGVGIVGAFAIEAPASLPILLIGSTDAVADRIVPYRRVVVAEIMQDSDSIATIAMLRALLCPPSWRRVAVGLNLEVFERTDDSD